MNAGSALRVDGPERALPLCGNVGAGFTRSGGGSALRHFCDRNLFNGSHSSFERFCHEHASAVLLWR